MLREWYSPDTVADKYFRKHIRWTLENLFEIQWYGWPVREKFDGTDPGHGYVASPGYIPQIPKGRSGKVERNTPAGVVGEVIRRLKLTGFDGALTALHYCSCGEFDIEQLSKAFGLSRREVAIRISRVLTYCSGVKKKVEGEDVLPPHKRMTYHSYAGLHNNRKIAEKFLA